MTTEERKMSSLAFARENEDLKLLHEANLLIRAWPRAFRHRLYKKLTRRCYPAGAEGSAQRKG